MEFSQYKLAADESRNFIRNRSEVDQSIADWYFMAERWSHRLHYMYGYRFDQDFQDEELKLAEQQTIYGEKFAAALTTVAADCQDPDRAREAVAFLISHEDTARRKLLKNRDLKHGTTNPSESYVTQLALAFGDPNGYTVMDGTENDILTEEQAIQLYQHRLSTHAGLILDERRLHIMSEIERKPKRSLGSVAANALRHVSNRLIG